MADRRFSRPTAGILALFGVPVKLRGKKAVGRRV
jgi:hypothetical protein